VFLAVVEFIETLSPKVKLRVKSCHVGGVVFFQSASLAQQNAANKACTRQVGVCAVYEHFSGFKFFLLPNIVHARPLAGNANR